MYTYEKKYNEAQMRADEAVQKGCLDKAIFDEIFPPEESEDERIRKWLVDYFGSIKNTAWIHRDITCEQILAWLEKQKEQKEELVYRLNGLMQDYIKEGKDDEEKEHRLKCYQLFWDALEDTNFFEQKEQKELPLMDGNADLYFDEWNQQKQNPTKRQCFNEGMRYARRLQKEQKPAWSEEDKLTVESAIFWLKRRLLYEKAEDISTDSCPLSMRKTIERLESFRPSWKPSEEQMEAFRIYLYNPQYIDNSEDIKIKLVESLYNDLLKLTDNEHD